MNALHLLWIILLTMLVSVFVTALVVKKEVRK